MAVIHFLNVKQGDCTFIQHNDGKVTVIDVCNAFNKVDPFVKTIFKDI